jgi:iron complex outermembrane receptor protein
MPTQAVSATDTSSDGLQEVLVTATKRAEDIQEVPIPITAISGDQLRTLGVQNVFDLAAYSPSLRIESYAGLALPRFNLRGLGTNEYQPNANGSVGFYQNEVFFNSVVAQALQLFDIDQVEVLRGPQGTLWGKNTTAGAISVTSRGPTGQLDASASATLGNYDSYIVEAAVGGPLVGENLLARASVIYNYFGGYVKNTYLDTIDNKSSQSAARFQLQWNFNDNGGLRMIGHFSKLSEVVPTFHAGYFPGSTDANGYSAPDTRFRLAMNQRQLDDVDASGASAKIDWTFSNAWHLTNILALERNSWASYYDDDVSPFVISNEALYSWTQQYSEEFRLSSPDRGPVSWIFGFYGLYEDMSETYALPQNTTSTDSQIWTRDYAGFANATIRFSERWSARLGVRYTSERKSIEQKGVYYTYSPIDQFNAALSTTPLVPFVVYNDNHTWNQATGDVTVQYQYSDQGMVFTRVASGFRGGNYNTALFGPGENGFVGPEKLLDYELGAKTTWLDRRLQVNLTGYNYDYRDLQVFLLQNFGTVLQNAAKARVDGIELEALYAPTPKWLFRLSGSYTNARYTSFPNASVPSPLNGGAPADLSGQPLERAPKSTVDLLVKYSVPLKSGTLTLQTDWDYTGRVIFAPWVDSPALHPVPGIAPYLQTIYDLTTQGGVTIGNARVAYATADDRLELATWVKNITNEQYKPNMYNFTFNSNAGLYWNLPTTYGVTLTYKFAGQ